MHEKFKSSLQGYNKIEVNEFVNKVTKEYESLLNKYKEANKKIAALENELRRSKQYDSSLYSFVDDNNYKKDVYEDARAIMDEAKKNASKIVNTALLRAEKIENESENIRRKVMLYKKRFRNLVEENLDEIEMFNDTL